MDIQVYLEGGPGTGHRVLYMLGALLLSYTSSPPSPFYFRQGLRKVPRLALNSL